MTIALEKPRLAKGKDMDVAECLVCSSHRLVPKGQDSGHEWCKTCKQTTNHIIVKQDE